MFDSLPDEILDKICRYLSVSDLFQLTSTQKSLYNRILCSNSTWIYIHNSLFRNALSRHQIQTLIYTQTDSSSTTNPIQNLVLNRLRIPNRGYIDFYDPALHSLRQLRLTESEEYESYSNTRVYDGNDKKLMKLCSEFLKSIFELGLFWNIHSIDCRSKLISNGIDQHKWGFAHESWLIEFESNLNVVFLRTLMENTSLLTVFVGYLEVCLLSLVTGQDIFQFSSREYNGFDIESAVLSENFYINEERLTSSGELYKNGNLLVVLAKYRSGIEFLKVMFNEITDRCGGLHSKLYVFDEILEEVLLVEGLSSSFCERIQTQVPRQHWWWRALNT